MVALVELRQAVAGLLRIDHHLVEIDDAVEGAAADEVVQGQAQLLLGGRVVALEWSSGESISEGRERRADDAQAMGMSKRDQLLVTVDDVGRGGLGIVRGEAAAGPAD